MKITVEGMAQQRSPYRAGGGMLLITACFDAFNYQKHLQIARGLIPNLLNCNRFDKNFYLFLQVSEKRFV